MKLFYSNSSAKAEIAGLEERITGFEAAATNDAAIITRLTSELATAKEASADHEEAVKALESSEVELAKSKADTAIANEKLSTFDAEVEKSAMAKFSGLGGAPIAEVAGNPIESSGSKTMTEFRAMTPAARMAHVQSGGKLTD